MLNNALPLQVAIEVPDPIPTLEEERYGEGTNQLIYQNNTIILATFDLFNGS